MPKTECGSRAPRRSSGGTGSPRTEIAEATGRLTAARSPPAVFVRSETPQPSPLMKNISDREPQGSRERTRNSLKKESVPRTVSFRIDSATASALAERAKSYGVSSHELARNYVETVLAEGEERAQVLTALGEIYSLMGKLRESVATGFYTILTTSGAAKEEEARKWAEDNL